MPGVKFDRAVAFYDASRALPDGVAEQVRDAILDRVGTRPGTRFLEIGVGTDVLHCRSSVRATATAASISRRPCSARFARS
jgi:ubiquinone/menaquinone biosynthesis C-methylase UbiE